MTGFQQNRNASHANSSGVLTEFTTVWDRI
jgi:hypothetical protein